MIRVVKFADVESGEIVGLPINNILLLVIKTAHGSAVILPEPNDEEGEVSAYEDGQVLDSPELAGYWCYQEG